MKSFFPLLTFHNIDDRPSVTSVSPGVFNRGMAKLHSSGYRTLSQMEVVDILNRGALFPERYFGITFDDGYQSVYTKAFSVLQRYGMSATVFLAVGKEDTSRPKGRLPSLDGRSMLNWNEIREMQRWGIEFGAHTCTHPDLTLIPFHLVKKEVCESKAIIEDALGTPVIVKNLGGMPELIKESGGGCIYDTDDDLVAAMDRIMADPSYRNDLGRRGYQTYKQKWTEEAHLKRYFDLINDIKTHRKPISLLQQ